MENNNLENVVTSQPFEPVSIKVICLAPQRLLCASPEPERIIDGLTVQQYNNGGAI